MNNLLSPVRFAEALRAVPARALLLELAPHALLQAVLRRALPDAAHVPLLRRDARDPLAHLLAAAGRAYGAGALPRPAALYPPVAWPVSRGTPSLASHVEWDHSAEWAVAEFKSAARTGESVIEYDLGKPDDAFLAGHDIDGRVLFPATGYLVSAALFSASDLFPARLSGRRRSRSSTPAAIPMTVRTGAVAAVYETFS